MSGQGHSCHTVDIRMINVDTSGIENVIESRKAV